MTDRDRIIARAVEDWNARGEAVAKAARELHGGGRAALKGEMDEAVAAVVAAAVDEAVAALNRRLDAIEAAQKHRGLPLLGGGSDLDPFGQTMTPTPAVEDKATKARYRARAAAEKARPKKDDGRDLMGRRLPDREGR